MKARTEQEGAKRFSPASMKTEIRTLENQIVGHPKNQRLSHPPNQEH
jgi:hypothetical protein